jgi:hypothetical protein
VCNAVEELRATGKAAVRAEACGQMRDQWCLAWCRLAACACLPCLDLDDGTSFIEDMCRGKQAGHQEEVAEEVQTRRASPLVVEHLLVQSSAGRLNQGYPDQHHFATRSRILCPIPIYSVVPHPDLFGQCQL